VIIQLPKSQRSVTFAYLLFIIFKVDGSWSPWSGWSPCQLNSPETRGSSMGDSCFCRRRQCDSPTPFSGGRLCQGLDMEVTNCTQHGQWTLWSDWSDCSSTCDVGLRQRRRTCGNPAPAFGGKVCIGEVSRYEKKLFLFVLKTVLFQDIATQTCEHLPSCSRELADMNIRLTPWSEWSECSTECGKGLRSRTRSCSNSQSVCDNARTLDYSECESHRCADYIKVFDYSPWVRLGNDEAIDWKERRFRYEYSVPASSSDTIKAISGLVLSEDRSCRGSSLNCSVITVNSLKDANGDDWTDWSRCSRECGGGYQTRISSW
jgi:semaphorin 5